MAAVESKAIKVLAAPAATTPRTQSVGCCQRVSGYPLTWVTGLAVLAGSLAAYMSAFAGQSEGGSGEADLGSIDTISHEVTQAVALISIMLSVAILMLALLLLRKTLLRMCSGSQAGRGACCSRLMAPRSGVFAWLRGELQGTPDSSLLAELLGLFWLLMGAHSMICGVLLALPSSRPTSLTSFMAWRFIFGSNANSLMYPLGTVFLHYADAAAIDIYGTSSTTRVRRWLSSSLQACMTPTAAEGVIDAITHWGVVLLNWFLSKIAGVYGPPCTSGLLDDASLGCRVAPLLFWLTIVGGSLQALLRVLTLRSTILNTALSRVGPTLVAGILLPAVILGPFLPPHVWTVPQNWTIGIFSGLIVPAIIYVSSLFQDLSKVGSLTRFLRYMSHEVRVPANAAVLAVDEILGELQGSRAASPSGPSSLAAANWATTPVSEPRVERSESKGHRASHGLRSLPGSDSVELPRAGSLASTPGMAGEGGTHSIASDGSAGEAKVYEPPVESPGHRGAWRQSKPLILPPIRTTPPPASLLASDKTAALEDALLGPAVDARSALMHMKGLLDRTLDLAKLEAGLAGLDMMRFNFTELCTSIGSALAPAFRLSGVSLDWRLQGTGQGDVWLEADALRLQQALTNILQNGAKYAGRGNRVTVTGFLVDRRAAVQASPSAGGVAVDVDDSTGAGLPGAGSAKASGCSWMPTPCHSCCICGQGLDEALATGQQAKLVLRIVDTGRGMTPQEQASIFTPFSRLHTAEEGTGLGLNIAKKAMQAHGGDVLVWSAGRGRGTTFTVSAVVGLAHPVQAGVEAAADANPLARSDSMPDVGAGAGPAAPPASGLHVLVVDDDTATRRIVSRLVRRLPGVATVACASDGREAVSAVLGDDAGPMPHLITLDNSMPRLTGEEAALELRAGGFQGLIVGMTGNALACDLASFRDAGADEVVVKPVRRVDLVRAVEQALQRKGGAPPPELSPV